MRAVQVTQAATTEADADAVLVQLAALDGYLGGRRYVDGGWGPRRDRRPGVEFHACGYKVQAFFREGAAAGPVYLIPEGLQRECGFAAVDAEVCSVDRPE